MNWIVLICDPRLFGLGMDACWGSQKALHFAYFITNTSLSAIILGMAKLVRIFMKTRYNNIIRTKWIKKYTFIYIPTYLYTHYIYSDSTAAISILLYLLSFSIVKKRSSWAEGRDRSMNSRQFLSKLHLTFLRNWQTKPKISRNRHSQNNLGEKKKRTHWENS